MISTLVISITKQDVVVCTKQWRSDSEKRTYVYCISTGQQLNENLYGLFSVPTNLYRQLKIENCHHIPNKIKCMVITAQCPHVSDNYPKLENLLRQI